MMIDNITDKEQVKEYLELYKKTNIVEYLDKIAEYISRSNVYYIDFDIKSIEEVSFTTSSGENLLDILLKYYDKLPYDVKELFANDPEIIAQMIKEDNYGFASFLKEETLQLPVGASQTLFDFLIENDHFPSEKLKDINNYPGLVQKLFEVDPALLQYLNTTTILNETFNGEKLIDFMLKNKLLTSETIKNIRSNNYDAFIDYLLKYNQEGLLKYLNEDILLKEKEGKTVLEYLIENGIVFDKIEYSNQKVLDILLRNGQFESFKNVSEYNIIKKSFKGKTFLEDLLENNVDYKIRYPYYSESMLLFLQYEKYDQLYDYSIDNWLEPINEQGITPLDVIISKFKAGLDFDLAKIKTYSNNPEKLAQFYLKMAENGLINYVKELEPNDLLEDKKGVRLIDVLLDENKELTMDVILTKKNKEDFRLASYLRSKGIDQKEIKIPLHSMDIVDEYYNKETKQYQQEKVTEEQEDLLNRFRELMIVNEETNRSYLEALIASYRHLMHLGNPLGEIELRKLIDIKEKDPEFAITEGSGYYNETNNSIYVNNTCINTLNHETGHLLFHNLTDKEVPQEYYHIVRELRENPEFIKKVEEYTYNFAKIKNAVEEIVKTEYIPIYEKSITEEKKEEIEKFLDDIKEKKKEELKSEGYSDETIEILLSKAFSLEEYLEQDKRIKREELVEAILRTKYGAFIAIGDIIDGIVGGEYRSEELRNEYGNTIPHAFGHGIPYYHRNSENAFDEAMANYSAIVKSDDARDVMSYLRDIVGDNFVNLIDNYYTREIAFSTREVKKVSHSL